MSAQPDNPQFSTLNSRLLKQYWGYDRFRGIQEDIINSISENKDTLGLMPTGGGKSITFQVPALAKDGLCLVITPLIALMKDQVQNLRKRGIKALAIYSGMNRQDIITTLENCIFGNYKFLYISPERLDTEIFRIKLRKMKVSMITVDESHCISQWGYDFRPAYLKIAEIRELLPDAPVLALTATATPEVVKDIQTRLHFRRENVFRMSFERNNLAYIVRKTENKTAELLHILRSMPGSAIVYVRNRRRTKEITELLNNEDITADFYHAGLDDASKDIRQHRWQSGESRVMVATNAFGMGIDKPDVRIVIHMDLPDYMEPVGVGLPADLLLRRPDVRQAERLVNAQAALLGASKSDWLPQVFLKGSVGYAARDLKDLTRRKSMTFEIAPTLSWTLFSGTKLVNATKQARAQLDEAVHNFNETVLTAVQETDNAMNNYRNSIKQIVALREVRNQGQETLKLSLELYKQGLSPFQNVLDALRSLLTYENQLTQAEGSSLLYLVSLYQALGGGYKEN